MAWARHAMCESAFREKNAETSEEKVTQDRIKLRIGEVHDLYISTYIVFW